MTEPPGFYTSLIVPALHRIQQEHGYLAREALERYAKASGFPLYRLQEVASFFPHFHLEPPAEVTLRVCRDMACHLAGADVVFSELTARTPENVAVRSVSCLGRCDRAPAVGMILRGLQRERFYLGRSPGELMEIAGAAGRGQPPEPDEDAARPMEVDAWCIDPYTGVARDYLAVRQALAARDSSLRSAVDHLKAQFGWGIGSVEQFRVAATNRQGIAAPDAPGIGDAVRAWQTETDWAQGPRLGGWAEEFLQEMAVADLRGMGGAGVPATQKWRDVRNAVRKARLRQEDDRAFIVVNGDESEPGTFKDRELLLRVPHLVVEAAILAGLITEATQGFIYIRSEYPEQIEACRAEIRRAELLGLCGEAAVALGRPFPLSVFVSPGGYICGEQSALLEAMSDRRAEPRDLPPKLETNGLLNLPTLVSNVETFAWVPYIVLQGGEAYAALGINGWKGRRFFSLSGDVQRPGVYEVPMGLTLGELIHGEAYGQGIAGGRPLKAVAPSGPSGGFLPALLTEPAGLSPEHAKSWCWPALAARRGLMEGAEGLEIGNLELELNLFRELSPTQALGAGIIVYAEGRDMVREAVNSLQFFRRETCGKCVPCRIGSQKLAALGENLLAGRIPARRWQTELLPLITEMGEVIALTSICGLGRSLPVPLRSVISLFPEDLAAHLTAPGEEAPL